jgi:hypothetical protein
MSFISSFLILNYLHSFIKQVNVFNKYVDLFVKPSVSVAFAVVSTHQPALGPRGMLWPVLLMCNQ